MQYLNVVFLVATWEMLQEYGAITVRRGNTCLRLWMGWGVDEGNKNSDNFEDKSQRQGEISLELT